MTTTNKELVATWDNTYGVDWQILRKIVDKQLKKRPGYLTVKVDLDGERAQMFFEETNENSTKPSPSPNGGDYE